MRARFGGPSSRDTPWAMSQEISRIEKTILLNRLPEEVWEYISDPRNDPQWCKKVRSVEQIDGDRPGPEARYRVIHRPERPTRSERLEVTIEEFEPPKRMRIREEDDDGVFDVTYVLEPTGAGTRLTQQDEIAWKVPRLQRPAATTYVGRDIVDQLSRLKRLLEES
jgi:uncharacterized protein YndB with AHSA1/START domain